MANSDGFITAPVSFADANHVLGTSHTDLASLCKDDNVNIWSKYKPIKNNLIATTDQWDFTNARWKDTATWWKGSDGKCGFVPYYSNNYNNIISNTNGGMNGWTYNGKPTGGSASPYRLTDFAMYQHNAVPFLANFTCNEKVKANAIFQASCMVASDYDNVVIGDIVVNGSALYFGVILTQSDGTVLKMATSDTPGTSGVSFTFPASITTGNGYKCYPMLTANPISIDGVWDANTYYTCPNLSPRTFNVVSSYIDMSIDAIYLLDRAHAMVTVKNKDVSQHTIVVSARFTSSNYNSPLVVGEEQKAAETIGASTGSDNTKIFRFNSLLTDRSYYIYVYIDGVELRRVSIKGNLDGVPDVVE